MSRVSGVVVALVGLAACDNDRLGTQVLDDTGDLIDHDGPELTHTPIDTAKTYGKDVLIEAVAEDASGVFTVYVMYQQETSVLWKETVMSKVGDHPDGGSIWQGRIRGTDVGSGGMRYYLLAVDSSNQANEGCLPEDCSEEPWRFSVVPE